MLLAICNSARRRLSALNGRMTWAIVVLACLDVQTSAAAGEVTGIDPSDLAHTAKLTFSDEFDTLSLWNRSGGTWDTTYWWSQGKTGVTLASNHEQQWYTDALYAPTASLKPWSVSNGILSLIAAPADPKVRALINGYAYISGMLTTYRSFKQKSGYFEMRARLPAGKGIWPAFWMLLADGSWPPELDATEMLGHDPSTIFMTVHSNASGTHTQTQGSAKVPDTSAAFHTYGVLWEASKITWYFDGQPVYTTTPPSDLNKPLYILVNLALGGDWPGSPDATTPFPAVYQIDYVRAYAPLGTKTR
jgi:beta-glucanase (GH16 family)